MSSPPRFNPALSSIPASGIRRIANAAHERRSRGLPVYAFHLGEPGFDTPQPIKQAAIQALQDGHTHYAANAGIPELRKAIAHQLNQRHQTELSSDSVVVTIGACEALTLCLLSVLEPGQQVLVPTPCWPNYLHLPRLAGAEVIEVPTQADQGFHLKADQLKNLITPRTRAIVLNSPNNPTGAVLSKPELREVAELAAQHGIWLISDEIYQDIYFGPKHPTSLLEVSQPQDLVMVVSGFSKTYAMTGWRLGYVVTHPDYANVLLRLHQYLVTSASPFLQFGALRALALSDEPAAMREAYWQRCALVIETLKHLGIEFVAPQGAFYVFARVPTSEDSDAFCERMLIEHGLGFVPGSVFGPDFGSWFRICFAGSKEEVEAGMACLQAALSKAVL